MNVAGKAGGTANRVLAMLVPREDADVFVVTENGYGKRTPIADYPVKGRGTKGVLTVKLTEKKGGLAGALSVREHQDLLFISRNGMVQRTAVDGISRMGRVTQGVRVMNLGRGDRVSAVAPVIESSADVEGEDADAAPVVEASENGGEPVAASGPSGEDGRPPSKAPSAERKPRAARKPVGAKKRGGAAKKPPAARKRKRS
jgi:DNA gyrase subunit A